LRDIVNDINAANSHEQLEGYFDYLAPTYNAALERAGLPTFEVVGDRD
jgi:hypothetical protein